MNSWISLDLEKVLTRIRYDENSPSGLVWAEDHGGIRNKMYKKGQTAGKFTGKEYRVGLFGKSYSCSRIIYWIHHNEEDTDGWFIHHKDWDNKNNKISNLTKISVKEYRRLVITKHREENGLPPSEFLNKRETAKKYREENRDILNKKLKDYRKREIDRVLANEFEYRYLNKERKMWQSAKERALKNNLTFSIEISDIVIPSLCPILGIPLFAGEGKVHANSPSLDRIVPELGYTKDNIWVISHKANSIKTNANKDELLVFALWVMENYDDL